MKLWNGVVEWSGFLECFFFGVEFWSGFLESKFGVFFLESKFGVNFCSNNQT